MPFLVDTLQTSAGSVIEIPRRRSRVSSEPAIRPAPATRKAEHLLSAILTTSLCLHLLVVGYLGYGVPADAPRPPVVRAAPPPPIVENVRLEAPPPPKITRETLREDRPPPAAQDLPAPVAAIAAVPASVPVAFAIRVAGPVRLVSDASEAGGGALAPPPPMPRETIGRNLLTPRLTYPAEALYRRLTGRVVVEFRTTATGDIVDVKIRSSSGHELLDRAALENLRLGRWVGEAGYFTKTYDFVLR